MANVVVVGYGYAGRRFHSYLIERARGLTLYGVATRDPERRAAAEREHRVRVYSSFDECLADPNVDLLVIATPHNTHAELAISGMNAGKHIVTDKIMCISTADADAMIEARTRNGVILSVFHNRRWDWDFSTVKQALRDGVIGQPYCIEVAIMRYRRPTGWRAQPEICGGIFHDWGAHLVDQLLLINPADVDRVHADVQYRGWGEEIGSYGRLLLHFANDVLCQVEIGNLAQRSRPRWYVLGDTGALEQYGMDPQEDAVVAGDIDAATEQPAHRAKVYTEDNGAVRETTLESVRTSWKMFYANIADVLEGKAELAVKPEEARRVVRVLEAANLSAVSGASLAVRI